MSGVPGPAEEHDLHVRPWHLPAVRGPNERVPHLPQGHWAPHPPLLEIPRLFFFFLLSLSLEAHPDHARNATTTPAAAAAARPSSQHPSQPAKGVLRCLILHNKCSLNGLIVLWWNFCYKTRKKKIRIDFYSAVLSSRVLTAARKMLVSRTSPFSCCVIHSLPLFHHPLFILLFLYCFLCFYLICETSFLSLSRRWLLQTHGLGYERVLSLDLTLESQKIQKCEVGSVPFCCKVLINLLQAFWCQLQSPFIVIVNPYASVLVSEAPDVDFKFLILSWHYGKFVTHYCMHNLKGSVSVLASCQCSAWLLWLYAICQLSLQQKTRCWQFCTSTCPEVG